MEYNFREVVEKLLDERRRTKKSLASHLGMTGNGFDAMLKNNTVSAVKLAQIAEFLEVPVSYFYDTDSNHKDVRQKDTFGDEVIKKVAEDIGELRHDFEEQLRVKDRQLQAKDTQIELLLGLLGKFEGAIVEPLCSGDPVFDQRMHEYVNNVLGNFGHITETWPILPEAKLVAPLSQPVGKRL